MVGPSLEAIRKFKERQQKKQEEEDERKLQEKLSTLEHRASQGDRKAKSTLIKIEKIKNQPAEQPTLGPSNSKDQISRSNIKPNRPKPAAFDFDDLMNLAKQNETKKLVATSRAGPELPKVAKERKPTLTPTQKLTPKPIPKPTPKATLKQTLKPTPKPTSKPTAIKTVQDKRSLAELERQKIELEIKKVEIERRRLALEEKKLQERFSSLEHRAAPKPKFSRRPQREDDYDDDDDDMRDFVVEDDEDDVADEVSRTIRSVFKYDKRKCDRREEELDRQYRAIGKVNTYEDLEREERRASRLAAAEDARAQRDEEERKRLKAIRMKNNR